MRRLTRLWPAFETIPGLAAERLEWQRQLKDEWPIAEPLLRPVGRVADQVWCPSPSGDGCPRQVVQHDDGRIVAVCGDRPKRCDPLSLTIEDVVVWELDVKRLAKKLAAIFQVECTDIVAGPSSSYCLGEHLMFGDFGVPVLLWLPGPFDSDARAVANFISREARGSVILLTPTRWAVEESLSETLRAHTGVNVPLIESVGVDGDALIGLRPLQEIFAPIREHQIRLQNIKLPACRFPTPTGSRWADVTIRFITGHEVHIQVCNKSCTYEFTQMGMSDRRTRPVQPDTQWKLLQILSTRHGQLTWLDGDADRKHQKTKEKLSKILESFFNIEEEPFDNLPNGWQTRFTLLPDGERKFAQKSARISSSRSSAKS